MSRGIIGALIVAILIVAGILIANHFNQDDMVSDSEQSVLQLEDVLPAGYDMAVYENMSADEARQFIQAQIDAGTLPAEALDLIMAALNL